MNARIPQRTAVPVTPSDSKNPVYQGQRSWPTHFLQIRSQTLDSSAPSMESFRWRLFKPDEFPKRKSNETYRWHSQLPLEPPPHTIVDSLWFPPIRRNAFEHVALVAVEVLCACTKTPIITMALNQLLALFL